MNDEELLLQAANCPTIFIDGLGAFRKLNGVLRMVGYVIDGGAQLNLVIPLKGAQDANVDVARVLKENASTKAIHIWNGAGTVAH